MPSLVDVYAYRIHKNEPAFLLLKRSDKVIYAGEWRMIGGKINELEPAWKAALRELSEETGLQPKTAWCVPSVNSFFEFKSNTLHHIPVFSVELEHDSKIELNHEHSEYGWFSPEEAQTLLLWPEQKRLLSLISSILRENRLSKEWIIPNSYRHL